MYIKFPDAQNEMIFFLGCDSWYFTQLRHRNVLYNI